MLPDWLVGCSAMQNGMPFGDGGALTAASSYIVAFITPMIKYIITMLIAHTIVSNSCEVALYGRDVSLGHANS